jgi:hypothetical protein
LRKKKPTSFSAGFTLKPEKSWTGTNWGINRALSLITKDDFLDVNEEKVYKLIRRDQGGIYEDI